MCAQAVEHRLQSHPPWLPAGRLMGPRPRRCLLALSPFLPLVSLLSCSRTPRPQRTGCPKPRATFCGAEGGAADGTPTVLSSTSEVVSSRVTQSLPKASAAPPALYSQWPWVPEPLCRPCSPFSFFPSPARPLGDSTTSLPEALTFPNGSLAPEALEALKGKFPVSHKECGQEQQEASPDPGHHQPQPH